ncbi:MAG TPA: hypothetical protein VFN56_01015 [Candidatus Saccharimonadales bacterium]|nr:hypothetical protein [Candidatus Saccharimonadales bacterium]
MADINDLVRFPIVAAKLITLGNDDQEEIRRHQLLLSTLKTKSEQTDADRRLACNARVRAKELLQIVSTIPAVTLSNVGVEASKAVIVVALHSYLDVMQYILNNLETTYEHNPHDVYRQGIPPLRDRISILLSRQQEFGTNWMVGQNGRPYLIPVRNFDMVNANRKKYGLDPVRRPVDLSYGAKKYPLGKGLATAQDQRPMTDHEYDEYAKYYLHEELNV